MVDGSKNYIETHADLIDDLLIFVLLCLLNARGIGRLFQMVIT